MGFQVYRMERDRARFGDIVRGRLRKDLRRYLSTSELLGRQGKKTISIPVPQIELPRFRFGDNQGKGVGQGPGEDGEAMDGEGKDGEGTAGIRRGATSSRSRSTSSSSRRCSGGSWSSPTSSRGARSRSRWRAGATRGSVPPGPSRCATTGARSAAR